MEKITGIIIQARISSTRLPRKVIEKIEGKTVLEHVIERVKKINIDKKVILATTQKKEDDILEEIGRKAGILVYRGSEDDVLDRFYQAAVIFEVDPIVRITADCPLLDSEITERVIDLFFKNEYDYVSNTNPPTFPDGLDVGVFSFRALKEAWENAKLSSDREHVVTYITKNPKIFKIGNLAYDKDISHIRLTLDEEKDLVLIKKVYERLYNKNPFFGLKEIIELFESEPDLIKINSSIERNEGYKKSLKEDKIYEDKN
jgi:spore coat polysaccharide biosynthesis protein SpsF (cytidylyltransferase family)